MPKLELEIIWFKLFLIRTWIPDRMLKWIKEQCVPMPSHAFPGSPRGRRNALVRKRAKVEEIM